MEAPFSQNPLLLNGRSTDEGSLQESSLFNYAAECPKLTSAGFSDVNAQESEAEGSHDSNRLSLRLEHFAPAARLTRDSAFSTGR